MLTLGQLFISRIALLNDPQGLRLRIFVYGANSPSC
jgi:hypothetical protein